MRGCHWGETANSESGAAFSNQRSASTRTDLVFRAAYLVFSGMWVT
jgi:hypothetical protein